MSNMNAGGAETFLMKLYREIDRTQYQMDFCVNVQEKNYYEDEINELGGNIFRIPARSEGLKEHNRQLAKLIKNKQYKYVLIVSASSTAYLDAYIAKKSGAKKCIIRSSNSKNGSFGLKNIIEHILKKLFNHCADVLIAPSDLAAKNLFGDKFEKDKRFKYLNNGLDLSLYRFYMDERNRIRRKHNISDDTLVIGHIGRFNGQKNHLFLVDIIAELSKRENAILIFVGNGDLKEEIRKKVSDIGLSEKVIFAGLSSEVASYLSAMDVFVFPSFYEGMPNTVIEAQANGIPCVISDAITKNANVTGLVTYLPLASGVGTWVDTILQMAGKRQINAEKMLAAAGYEIKDCAKQFVGLCFD